MGLRSFNGCGSGCGYEYNFFTSGCEVCEFDFFVCSINVRSLPSPPLPPPPPSVSSNYQVLMPQFLRAVRVLCALHKYYMGGVAMDALQYPLSSSVPASPSATASGPQGIYELYSSLYE